MSERTIPLPGTHTLASLDSAPICMNDDMVDPMNAGSKLLKPGGRNFMCRFGFSFSVHDHIELKARLSNFFGENRHAWPAEH
jgi:hypothetical protein